jgi:succinate dehydrogenase/fumarate reductase cytochrome b subunit
MATTEAEGLTLQTDSLDGVHWVGILAAFVSAGIHLLLGIRMLPSGMGISFVLAGLGFLGAIGLVLVGYRRRTVYVVGIPFVAVQIVLWFVINFVTGSKSFPADIGAIGALDKFAQLVLLGVLIALLRPDRSSRS